MTWIKCSERMPPADADVLVWGDNGSGSGADLGHWHHGEDAGPSWPALPPGWWTYRCEDGRLSYEPTHWQPLPEGPA